MTAEEFYKLPCEQVFLEQGSDEWKALRSNCIGASEAAIIDGCPKYEIKTLLQLWELKKGLRAIKDNFAMAHGRNSEEEARQWASDELGVEFKPAIYRRGPLIASLDGIDIDRRFGLEVKCPQSVDNERFDDVPDYDLRQLWQQFLVIPSLECIYYVVWHKDRKEIKSMVRPDGLDEYLKKALKFAKYLESDTPPPASELDTVDKSDDSDYTALEIAYADALQAATSAKMRADELKQKLIDVSEPHTVGKLFKVDKVYRKGSVDYKAIPELKVVDIESYRKPGTEFYTVKEVKQ